MKKENAIVIAAQHLPFFLLYNGRELKEVANKQELNPAKRLVDPSNVAQRPVDGISKVGTQHAHFVYNEQLDISNELFARFVHRKMTHQGVLRFKLHRLRKSRLRTECWNKTRKRQLKEGMDGDSTCVECRNTGWRYNCQVFISRLLDFAQQGCFTRAGLSRQKNGLLGLVDELFSKVGCGTLFLAQSG